MPAASVLYTPGVCNIGPEEIRRRRRSGYLGAIVSIVMLGLLFAFRANPLWRLVAFFPVAAAASGFFASLFPLLRSLRHARTVQRSQGCWANRHHHAS